MKFVFLAVSLLLLPLICSGRSDLGPMVGGWKPIKDLNDAHVKEIAAFAVSERSKQLGVSLNLDHVVKGEQQVVSGITYRLTLVAKDGGAGSKQYVATVWEKPWEKFRKLTSFKPASH